MNDKLLNPSSPFAVVVNDDPTQLTMLSGLVRKAGLEPHAFSSAEDALANMSGSNIKADTILLALPALIVTDLFMPGIDGWRFCRLLRSPEYSSLNHIPILVVSATYAGDEASRIATDLGAEAFLPSPVDVKRFVEQVQKILSGQQTHNPLRVLIVDDEPAVCDSLKMVFLSRGFEAQTALTVQAAAEAFNNTAFDVAVLDYHLADGTGDTLLDTFRLLRPDCVCLMMTSDPGPKLAIEWMKRGAAAYVHKPFEPDYLIELCAKARRERSLLRVQELLEMRTRELRESEARFRSLFQNMESVFSLYEVVLDNTGRPYDWRYLEVNPAFEKLTGKKASELIGKTIREVFPLTEAYWFEKFEEAFISRKPIRFEKHSEEMDSSIELNIYTPQKEQLAMISDDITQRKRTEEALRESEEKYRMLAENTSDVIWILDLDQRRFLYVSPSVEHLRGYTPKEVMMGDLATTVTPASLQNLESIMPARLARFQQGIIEFHTDEIEQSCKDGSTVWTEVTTRFRLNPATGHVEAIGVTRDITEHKAAEETLKNSHSLLLATLESTADGILVVDIKGKVTSSSRRFLDLWKIPESLMTTKDDEQLLRFVCGQLMFPDVFTDKVQALYQTPEASSIDELVFKDGRIFERYSQPQRIGEAIVGRVWSFRDVTQRKRTEEALRESEKRFSLAMEANNDGLWDWNVSSGEVYYNPRYSSMLGYYPNDVPAKLDFWTSHLHPEDKDAAVKANSDCIENLCETFAVEYRMRTKNGDWRWILGRGKAVSRDSEGRAIRLIGTHTDITEQKQAGEKLRESEELLRESQIIARIGSYVLDFSSGMWKSSGVLDSIFGIDDAFERSTEGWISLIHPDDRKRMQDYLTIEVIGNRRRFDKEYRIIKNIDHTERWVHGLGELEFDSQHQLLKMFGTIQDITERKRAEEERVKLEALLQQAQKMESVGRLAGGVAHDFNNMLGVILGYSEMAINLVEPSHPLNRHLTQIRNAAERSATLTQQLLAFARKQTVAPKVLDLNETVAGMFTMLQRLIGEDIELTWQPGKDLWSVKVDPSQIDQMLANLCVNARDAITDVGKISIETENIAFDEQYCANHAGFIQGEYVLLAVKDNGCGMNKDTMEHLFEPFFTTKGLGKGTGLGLATVYGAVKQNSGFIDVSSEPGSGTTFTIYLPRHEGKSGQAFVEVDAKQHMPGKETILLVEDEPAILEMATMMLEHQGYTVLAALTPGEAIHLAREHSGDIDLLMTDVVMPEMNGRDLAKNLLSLYPKLKRLFMSGYTADVIAHHSVLEEGVHFIQKPFKQEELVAKIRGVLDDE